MEVQAINTKTAHINDMNGNISIEYSDNKGNFLQLSKEDAEEIKESIDVIFSKFIVAKTVEEVKIEELEKEKAEIINENNKLRISIDELISRYSEFVETKEDYQVDKLYKVGDTFKYNGVVYAVVQEHTSMEHWNPETTLSLYKVLNSTVEADTEVVIAEFKQPTGTHDAYQLGDKVLFNGRVYESIHPTANTWSPTAYPQAWKDLGLIEDYQGV